LGFGQQSWAFWNILLWENDMSRNVCSFIYTSNVTCRPLIRNPTICGTDVYGRTLSLGESRSKSHAMCAHVVPHEIDGADLFRRPITCWAFNVSPSL